MSRSFAPKDVSFRFDLEIIRTAADPSAYGAKRFLRFWRSQVIDGVAGAGRNAGGGSLAFPALPPVHWKCGGWPPPSHYSPPEGVRAGAALPRTTLRYLPPERVRGGPASAKLPVHKREWEMMSSAYRDNDFISREDSNDFGVGASQEGRRSARLADRPRTYKIPHTSKIYTVHSHR